MNYGYCCINLSLRDQDIYIGRTMNKKTFQTKGLLYVGETALANLQDLFRILVWNNDQDILLYRMSSDMFPWMSEYEFTDLPNWELIQTQLIQIGKFVNTNGHRLTFHPGPFNVLASPNPIVVRNTMKELRQHAEIMDWMGLASGYASPINIHVGGTYGDKPSALKRFIENYWGLDPIVRDRLVVENDDKPNQYSVNDLYAVHTEIGIPITFDYHHHTLHSDGLTEAEALELAVKTWPVGVIPVAHYSSPMKLYERANTTMRSHADYIYQPINNHGFDIDIELEAKAKDLALLGYRKKFLTTS